MTRKSHYSRIVSFSVSCKQGELTMTSLNELYPTYFLAANAPGGFVHFYDTLYDPEAGERAFLLRGGPGSGKSTLMRQCVANAALTGQPVELFPCPAAPESLDAIHLPQLGVSVIDATSPHSIVPRYPGICEREIDLGNAWNFDKLYEYRQPMTALFQQEALLRSRIRRYIDAAGSLADDGYRIDFKCCDQDKARRFAKRLSCPLDDVSNSQEQKGREIYRFLSAITSRGLLFLDQTVTMQCNTILVIEDDWGACSGLILSSLKEQLLQKGYDCIVCPSPLAPNRKIDHLLVPSLSFAVCTSSWMFPVSCATERRVHARRFRRTDEIAAYKQHLRFNRRAMEELVHDAVILLRDANTLHGKLEQYYKQCTDYRVTDALTEQVCAKILDWCF